MIGSTTGCWMTFCQRWQVINLWSRFKGSDYCWNSFFWPSPTRREVWLFCWLFTQFDLILFVPLMMLTTTHLWDTHIFYWHHSSLSPDTTEDNTSAHCGPMAHSIISVYFRQKSGSTNRMCSMFPNAARLIKVNHLNKVFKNVIIVIFIREFDFNKTVRLLVVHLPYV